MAFKLTPEAMARAHQYGAWHKERTVTFNAMTDESLVATARMYIAQMSPIPFAPGEPVYDATMWHIILPELLRRLSN